MTNKPLTFKLPDWMANLMKLQNYELVVYAFIYSFNTSPSQKYNGSINYICERTNISRSSVIRSLKSLTEKGYLVKKGYFANNQKYVEYRCSQSKLEELGVITAANNEALKNTTFFTIYDWMIQRYNLMAHSLLVYALLHSFTTYNGKYFGSHKYIAERLNMSSKQVSRILSQLIEKGYIICVNKYDYRERKAGYKTVLPEEFEHAIQNNIEDIEDTDNNTNLADNNDDIPQFCINTEEEIMLSQNEDIDKQYFEDLERQIQENASMSNNFHFDNDFTDFVTYHNSSLYVLRACKNICNYSASQ